MERRDGEAAVNLCARAPVWLARGVALAECSRHEGIAELNAIVETHRDF